MLEELRIENFAIIDRLELEFSAGFNVITGETGAGKSIIIDAVELLLGNKADTDAVRAGADRAIIEGVFRLSDYTQALVMPLLEREELMETDTADYITLTRELRRSGRSSARINGVTVSADVLREVGEALVDIHGQSAHLSLFKPRSHIDLLDRYANLLEVREALGNYVGQLRTLQQEIRSLTEDKDALQRRAERLRYEAEEIAAADLQPDEEDEIQAERNRLANSEQLATLVTEAVTLLNGDDADEGTPAVDALMQVAAVMGRLLRIDPDLAEEHELAEGIAAQAQELAITLGSYADEIEYNPDRLNELEERLELIRSLRRRYKCDSVQAVIDYGARAAADLEAIDNSEERLEALRLQEDRMLRHIGELAARLSRARAVAGRELGQRIMGELQDLRMSATSFETVLEQRQSESGCYIDDQRYAFDATGVDQVEFMMSANPGEPMRPLARVASGGEAARIMLALKRVLTQADHTPVLIFDEIDQGIGGRIGAVVGEKLWSLSKDHQVMVVTHLAQLAGFGDCHYRVSKHVDGQRTHTLVTPLDDDGQRVDEIAAMLGAVGSSGHENARELLEDARMRKSHLSLPGG